MENNGKLIDTSIFKSILSDNSCITSNRQKSPQKNLDDSNKEMILNSLHEHLVKLNKIKVKSKND
jgi:hypothetical protein